MPACSDEPVNQFGDSCHCRTSSTQPVKHFLHGASAGNPQDGLHPPVNLAINSHEVNALFQVLTGKAGETGGKEWVLERNAFQLFPCAPLHTGSPGGAQRTLAIEYQHGFRRWRDAS
jgi:hypothetical protein